MNMSVEDSSEGLFNSPLFAYAHKKMLEFIFFCIKTVKPEAKKGREKCVESMIARSQMREILSPLRLSFHNLWSDPWKSPLHYCAYNTVTHYYPHIKHYFTFPFCLFSFLRSIPILQVFFFCFHRSVTAPLIGPVYVLQIDWFCAWENWKKQTKKKRSVKPESEMILDLLNCRKGLLAFNKSTEISSARGEAQGFSWCNKGILNQRNYLEAAV